MSVDSKGFQAKHVTVGVMVAVTIAGFCFLWLKAGGSNPADRSPYTVAFRTDDVKNLQPAGDVRMAGVLIGSVVKQTNSGDSAEVTLHLDKDVAPLHEGATFRVGLKSVIGQSFVDVVDGDGAEIASGEVLSAKSVIPAVDIDELVETFDPETRKALAGGLESLGAVTEGTREDVDQLMDGIGRIGSDGYTVVDAVAAQSEDLKSLVGDATVILAALEDRRSQITGLVDNAHRVAAATASQEDDLKATMTALPGLLSSARTATDELGGLATDLTPVARDLDAAAPDLNAALTDLPPVTQGLRTLLPPMKSSLSRAPKTIDQLPTTSAELQAAIPVADELLANANPMIEYLGPYWEDLGNFLGNFGATFNTPTENGVQAVRLAPIFNEYSVRNIPIDLQSLNPLHWNNNYPAPGSQRTPQKWTGTYPEITKDE